MLKMFLSEEKKSTHMIIKELLHAHYVIHPLPITKAKHTIQK